MPEQFGATDLKSLFEPPSENPLSEGGKWARTLGERPPLLKSAPGPGPGVASDSEHGNPNYSHWAAETFDTGDEGSVEVWGCIGGGQLGAALETWRVALWHVVGDGLSGYLVYQGGALSKDTVIRRYDAGIASFIGIAGAGSTGYPQRLGLRIRGDFVEAWIGSPTTWTLVAMVEDTTYRGKFYLGLAIEDPTVGGLGFSCFGGGVPRRTQFFRWTRGYKEPLRVGV